MMPASLTLPLVFAMLFTPLCIASAQYRDTPIHVSNAWQSDSLRGDVPPEVQPSAGEKLLWLAGASITFSLFDFVAFNHVRATGASMPAYRVLQTMVQAGISWILYEYAGLPTAVAFNIAWWTWSMDALYYVYADTLDIEKHGWEPRGSFETNIMGNRCTWAWWTPVGIAQGMNNKKPIAGDTLMAQMLLGAALAITVTVTL